MEALIRWIPPGRAGIAGHVHPGGGAHGLIRPITEWVVSEVCAQTRRWVDGGIALRISFNFPTGLWEVAMIERLLAKVRAAGVQPQQLVMEVTESAAMGNPAETARILELLQDACMPLAIDDFGTGYSSLSRLNHLPAETLKIDRSFVRDLPHDAPSVALTETIVRLARGVGMEPLAEGRPRPSGASWSSTAAISARDSCSAGRCRPPRSSGFGISGTARRPER